MLQRLLQTPFRSKMLRRCFRRASPPKNAASVVLRPRTEATKQPYRGASLLRLRGCLFLTFTFTRFPSPKWSVCYDRQ
jgi:hypothetical protein